MARTRAIGLILTAILIFAFVPKYGALGAAIGYAAALIVWNTILVIQLYRRMGIVTVIGFEGRNLPLHLRK